MALQVLNHIVERRVQSMVIGGVVDAFHEVSTLRKTLVSTSTIHVRYARRDQQQP
jgi:hypothetical protein